MATKTLSVPDSPPGRANPRLRLLVVVASCREAAMRRTLCARPTDGRQWNDGSYDSSAYGGVDFDSPAGTACAFAHLRQSKAVLNDERNLFSNDRRRRACPWQAFAVVFDDQRYFIGCVVPMHADMGRIALRMVSDIRQSLLARRYKVNSTFGDMRPMAGSNSRSVRMPLLLKLSSTKAQSAGLSPS